MLFINNYNIEKYTKEKLKIRNNIIEKDTLKEYINNKLNSETIKNKYKLEYLLNFFITQNKEFLASATDSDLIENNEQLENHQLEILKNLDTIDYKNSKFNDTDSIIIILNKINKINKTKTKTKKNTTKKQK